MFTKKKRGKKRSRAMLSAYSIIMILIVLLGVLSHVLPRAKYAAISFQDQDVESVEIGPGEWEDESPNGGPEELKVEAPEVTDEEHMEGESVDVVEVLD